MTHQFYSHQFYKEYPKNSPVLQGISETQYACSGSYWLPCEARLHA